MGIGILLGIHRVGGTGPPGILGAEVMTAPKRYPLPSLVTHTTDTRAGSVFKALCAVYPGQISAEHLMARAGLSWRAEPIWSFVSLCNDFIKINEAIEPFGWRAERSGGTPRDNYWLSPIGG
ncbi:hypothetical protein [Rhizobium rhizogenes]|uniref:hypothetical protein n=2 Tax=Rhizobiaceae TaxID=82115 RepID=UPI0022CBB1F5|nr:hypothetical protein [Rhizobium rhizogenes]MCZ7488207.1 hypothetical protein [Rhizobium rhizogenes]